MTIFERLTLTGISLLVRMAIIKFPTSGFEGKTGFVDLLDIWLEKTNLLLDNKPTSNNADTLFKLVPMKHIDTKWVTIEGNGCFNPFKEDKFSRGQLFCKDVYIMFDTAGEDPLSGGYFINTRTGQRQGLIYNTKEE